MQDPATFNPMKPHFPELEQLKCPRCESTNTKFCYYNNYNLSQPRHFCKNCRRYWTKGGALRNIPVGGATRKSNSKKRPKPDPDPFRGNPTRKVQDAASAQSMIPPAAAASTSTSLQEPSVSCAMSLGGHGTDPDTRGLYGLPVDQDHNITGSFSSLLATNGGFGSVFDGIHSSGSGFKMVHTGGSDENFSSVQIVDPIPVRTPCSQIQGDNGAPESFMQSGNNNSDSSCWSGGSNGWPDLSIFTPSSNFQ